MPSIQHILETALYVDDLGRSERFYRNLFGFRTLLADDRMRALRVSPGEVLLLFEKGKSVDGADTPVGHIPGHDGRGRLHMAFAVRSEEIEPWRQTLAGHGVEIISYLEWPQGGQSIYFRDPDGHVIELATKSLWPP